MEPLTWLSLGLQLAALGSIVAALLLYLLKKVRGTEAIHNNTSKTVLVTSVDTALGLQIATYLSSHGWRVIGGCASGGLGARLASSWAAAHEAAAAAAPPDASDAPPPRLATIELDVAREDLLEQAARATAQHLPAGEHGVWAVINTAGSAGRGGAECWEGVLRANVLGSLRVARAFTPLLAAAARHAAAAASTRTAATGPPRLFCIGLSSDTAAPDGGGGGGGEGAGPVAPAAGGAERGEAVAACAAARWAVWGACGALRGVLRARGVHVAVLHAPDLRAAELFAPPAPLAPHSAPASRPESPASESGAAGSCAVTMPGEAAEYGARVLGSSALRALQDALAAPAPRDSYCLRLKHDSWFARVPSLRMAH